MTFILVLQVAAAGATSICSAADGWGMTLEGTTILDTQTFEVCHTIDVRNGCHVAGPGGVLELRAGNSVVFEDGFSVLDGGTLVVEIDPSLYVEVLIPPAPTNLRLGPEFRFPGMRRLSWNMDSLTGVASYTVYQASFPIADANKDTAEQQVTASLHAAVDLSLDSGTQYFRVEAENVLGETGPLSTELTVDTTSRLAYVAEYDADEKEDALFLVPPTGGGATKVSAPPGRYPRDFSWSPNGADLAYLTAPPPDYVTELYVVSATGGGPIKVNDPLASGSKVRALGLPDFAWSPDGSLLAYATDDSGQNPTDGLHVVPATGGGATTVSDPGMKIGIYTFAWSPDGSHLAYMADYGLEWYPHLYVVPVTGGGATRVNNGVEAGGFAWSPDGSQLAFRAMETYSDPTFELYVVAATGGVVTKLNDPLVENASGINRYAWSPDGTTLAYLAEGETEDIKELYVVPVTGGSATKVSDPVAGAIGVNDFAWAPDGSQLAYSVPNIVGSYYLFELYVVPATGGGATKVSDPMPEGAKGVESFAWSPDGGHLAYAAEGDTDNFYELYVVAATGGGATKVNDPLLGNNWNFQFAWSPDGSNLVYLAEEIDGVYELYVAPATGGGATKVNDPIVPATWRSPQGVQDFAWSPLGFE